MKIFLCLFLVLCLSICSYGQTNDSFYKKGINKYELKDYSGAIEELTRAIDSTFFETNDKIRREILLQTKAKKQLADYYLLRGHAKFEIKDFDGAERDYWNVSILLPKYTEGHFWQGRAYFELGIFDLAKFKFGLTIEIDSIDAEAYFRRGLANYELSEFYGAISDYTKALQIHCCPPEAYYRRGIAKGKIGDTLGAIEDLSECIKLDVNNWMAYQERGLEKLILGYLDEAMSDFNISLRIIPNARTYRCRGNLKLMRLDYRGSIEDCNLSITLDPMFPTSYYTRGLAKIYLNQKESGCLDLSKAGELGMTESYEQIKEQCK